MKPAPFEYHAPETVEDVCGLLAEYGDEAKVLAGGQSLVPMLALRLTRFEHLVDVNRVGELGGFARENGTLVVQAGTRQRVMEREALVAAAAPLLARATPLIGHFQIRNRGTVGGSLAHADPASEYPAVAVALGAELDLARRGGARRRVAAADYFVGTWTTTAEPDELLVAARFPVWPERSGFAIEEVARRHGDFALAGVACAVSEGAQVLHCSVSGRPRSGPEPPRRHWSRVRRRPTWPRPQSASSTRPTTCTRPPRRACASRVISSNARSCAPRRNSVLPVEMTVNGERRRGVVEPRLTLADYLREHCALTGTHLGCEHGVCGACTVLLDGEAVRACLMFAVQADGGDVTTIEGLGGPDGALSTVQDAFREEHGLQCGFCTPGFVVSVTALLRENPHPTEIEIREALSGNLCRCTGYQGIIRAVERAAGAAQ